MKCSCPKCDAAIETSHHDVSASGSSLHCPECSDKFWAIREAFFLRAYKKQGRVYCFDCGQELGTEHLCVSCGSQCPDYCIVQASKPVARKQRRAGFSFTFSRRSKGPKPESFQPIASVDDEPASAVESTETSGEKTGSRLLIYAAIAALVLVVVGATGKTYMEYKADREYSKTFVTALYGVKSGTDACLSMIDGQTTKWRRGTGAGTGPMPRMDKKDAEKLQKVKGRVEQAVEVLGETPEKFIEAKTKLVKLQSAYGKIHALALSSSGSLNTYETSRSKLETDFFKSAAELKRSMPQVMLDELEIAINKYRNLEFMVKSK